MHLFEGVFVQDEVFVPLVKGSMRLQIAYVAMNYCAEAKIASTTSGSGGLARLATEPDLQVAVAVGTHNPVATKGISSFKKEEADPFPDTAGARHDTADATTDDGHGHIISRCFHHQGRPDICRLSDFAHEDGHARFGGVQRLRSAFHK